MPISYPEVEESVPVLLRQHFLLELVEAVVDDEEGFGELLTVCRGVSGGDEAAISLLFGELSERFDREPGVVGEILDAPSPAAAFAAHVNAHNDRIRLR